jgi:hypothetical protein
LERIGLEVDQQKQELILGSLQAPLATAAGGTLAGLAGGGLVCGVEPLVRLGKGSQQALELRERQAREGQKLAAVGPDRFVRDHAFILFLIPNNVYYLNEDSLMELLEVAVHAGADLESLKALAKRCSSWSRFANEVEGFIESQRKKGANI